MPPTKHHGSKETRKELAFSAVCTTQRLSVDPQVNPSHGPPVYDLVHHCLRLCYQKRVNGHGFICSKSVISGLGAWGLGEIDIDGVLGLRSGCNLGAGVNMIPQGATVQVTHASPWCFCGECSESPISLSKGPQTSEHFPGKQTGFEKGRIAEKNGRGITPHLPTECVSSWCPCCIVLKGSHKETTRLPHLETSPDSLTLPDS